MRNYKVVLEYDGTNYSGLQAQKGGERTVQDVVCAALEKLLCGKVGELNFCGRTDAGVHAFGQVLNVKTDFEFDFPTGKFALGLNYHLRGEGISAISSELVSDDFHARYSCKRRIYKYKILNRSFKSPIYQNRAWFIPYKIDVEKLSRVLQIFEGTHNFEDFRVIDKNPKNPIKTVDFVKVNLGAEGIIEVEIGGKSFLHQMVRGIIGASVDCVRGKFDEEILRKSLENPTFKRFFQFASPEGLYFLRAEY
jgi:tRNA pseudouridine38-40 synthase